MNKYALKSTITGLVSLTLAGGAFAAPPEALTFTPFGKPAQSRTVLLASKGADPVAETPSVNTWTFSDNAYAIANGFDDVSLFSGRGIAARQNLVIPKDNPDPKGLAEIEEDMTVMAHILNKAANPKDDKGRPAMGIYVHGGGWSSTTPRNLFVEGYGVIFFLNVSFPLVGPTEKKQESEPKEETSSEWEDARREVHRPPGQAFELNLPGVVTTTSPGEEYDADKVEDLKNDLISSLKNAAHIRKLKSDESVTIVVSGRSSSGAKTLSRRSGSSRNATATTTVRAASLGSESKGTKMLVRASKADVDSFQKDKMSLDDFRKKVTVMVY